MQDARPFKEVQKTPIWINCMVLLFLPIIVILQLYFKSMGDEVFIVTVVACLLLTVLLVLLRLEISITPGRIAYRLYPFQLKFRLVSMSDVERIWIRQYRPISEYGGWGIRYGSSGFAVNLKGSYGIQIIFKSGKKILIGTSQSARMNEALTKAGFTLSP